MRPPPIIEVAPGVWQIVLPWTRAYVLSDGTDFALVDTGTCRDQRLLVAAIQQLGLEPQRCTGIFLTHGHCDHAGNACYFAERGAKIYAHAAESPFLETGKTYAPPGLQILRPQGIMFSIGELYWPVHQLTLAAQLSDSDTIETPAGIWRVVHTPGHTPGHVAYFRQSDRTLISGDALLNILPFIRKPGLSLAQPVFTFDLAQSRQSAHKLAALTPHILLPGHGQPLSSDTAARIAAFVARLDV